MPSWAVRDVELRNVILKFCERRFYLRKDPAVITDEQRLQRIRQTELKYAASYHIKLRGLLERYKTEPEEKRSKLEIQIGNLDSQILMARRGNASVAAAVVYNYFRMGWDSVTVAQELGIKPPHIRQLLARLHNAADDIVYHSQKFLAGRVVRRAGAAARKAARGLD